MYTEITEIKSADKEVLSIIYAWAKYFYNTYGSAVSAYLEIDGIYDLMWDKEKLSFLRNGSVVDVKSCDLDGKLIAAAHLPLLSAQLQAAATQTLIEVSTANLQMPPNA